MSRLGLFITTVLVALISNASATITYLQCLGVDSNFTMVQGDTFTWHADCDTGADVWMEIWIDLNGNHQIDEGTDYAWQEGFTQTDGGSGGNGPGDMDGQANGEIYFEMELGLAPATWILRATDATDYSSQTCWGTITPMPNPAFVVQGQVSGPGAFNPENRLVAYDSDYGMWQALTDAGGSYFLNLGAGFAAGDTVPLQCGNAIGYVAPAETNVVLPAQGDTLYGVNRMYANPAAWLYGVLRDDRDSIITGSGIYIVAQPYTGGGGGGGQYRATRPDSSGAYAFSFSPADVGGDWRISVYYESYPPDHMSPRDSVFTVNQDDSINYTIIALYTDAAITGTVSENGGAPSGSYRLRYWSNEGRMETYSDAGTGAYTMPVSSLCGYGNLTIDTSARDGGTPLPAGYTVDGNWYKNAAPGDTVGFDLVQGAVIMGRLINASDSSTGLGYYNKIELTDWTWSMHDQQQTDSAGYFMFGVSPGSYRIYVSGDQGYGEQWYDGQQNSNNADTLTVAAGGTLHVDVYMNRATSISGTVLDSDSLPVANLGVEARDAGTGDWKGQGNTDSTGAYTITGLAAGSFVIRAFSDHGYLGKYWPDAQDSKDATVIVLNAGDTPGGYDFVLERSSSVSGSIYADDFSPVNNIRVEVYDTTYRQMGQAYTDSSGYYSISGLAAGVYALQVQGSMGFVGEWWNDRADFWSADPIMLGSGVDTSGFDMYLSTGGSIAGFVYSEADSLPVANMDVQLSTFDWMFSTQTTTDSTGAFSFGGLSAGSYRLGVYTRNGFIGEYYDGKGNDWEADTIFLGTNQDTSGFSMYLTPAASISGRVLAESDSMPMISVEVRVGDGMSYFNSAYTDSSGSYSVTVPAGSYFVYVSNPPGNYVSEEYDDRPLYSYIDTIMVGAGQAVTGIDLLLARGGAIAGNVRRLSDSTAVKWEEVRVYDTTGTFIGSDWTDDNGDYLVSGLLPGAYHVATWAGGSLVNQYYDGAYDAPSAMVITVAPGDTAGNISFLLPGPGAIAGYVTSDIDSSALQNVEVYLYAAGDTSSSVNFRNTDSNGRFVFDNVVPGAYFVYFRGMTSGYRNEYFSDASSFAAADTVMQNLPGDTLWLGEGLDVLRGAVIGTVTVSGSGNPLANVSVALFRDSDGDESPYMVTSTDSTGAYGFQNVPQGNNYQLFAEGMPLNYTNQWYDNQYVRSGAQQFSISDMVSLIDFSLDSGAVMAGSVFAAYDTSGIAGAEVVLIFSGDQRMYGSVMTDSTGAFTFPGVPAGSYYLACYAGGLGYGTAWWENASSMGSATQISVGAQHDTSGFAFYLQASGSISGQVLSALDSGAVRNVRVEVYDGMFNWIFDAVSDSSGAYTVDGLLPGTYFLRVENPDGYFGQWWAGRDDFSTADTVMLVNASDTAGFDFYLTPGATVNGALLRSADGAQISTGYGIRLISVDRGDTSYTNTWSNYYEFTGLAAGSYWVECLTGNYLDAGTDTFTVAAGDTAARNLYLQPRMVINEIHYNGGSAQYSEPTNPEFVELFVLDDIDLNGWSLSDRNMYTWWIMNSIPAAAGDYVVFHMGSGTDTTIGTVHHLYFNMKNGLGDAGGYVGLNAPDGNAVDLVVYAGGPGWGLTSSDNFVGWPNDGSNPADPGASSSGTGRSVSLMPDAADNNDGSSWYETFVTAGAVNELPVFFQELVADTGTFTFDGIGAVLTFIDSLGGSDTVAVRVFPDSLPPNLPGGNPIARFYQISAGPGLTGFTAVVTFTYTQAEFDASDITDESLIYAARWDGSQWVPYGSTVDTVNNTVTFTTDLFSLWSLGGPGGSVPVELSSFTAQQAGGAVELAWTTVSEEANLGWNVYRSIDGGAFEKISASLVAGAGFSAMPQSYGYTDAAVPAGAGEAMYYLVQIDATGGTDQSPVVTVPLGITGITLPAGNPGVPVFISGTPVAGTMRLAFRTAGSGPVNVTVYDMAGRIAAVLADGIMAAGQHEISWNTASRTVDEGMHLVRITAGGSTHSAVFTIIK